MSWLKKLGLGKQETLYDRARKAADPLIVASFREYGRQYGLAPTSKTSDQEILDIYQRVLTAFHQVATERGERLNAGIKNHIALYFFQPHESHPPEFFEQHLEYELDKYRKTGLRESYRKEIYPLELVGIPR
ncbi:hypothetical protein [Paraburkholderia sp. BR10954]|uniref:hypothetical protein n=1 Tax=Paraburkholderia sp. BR10954 TaxID=3236995 RepID=UPI0034D28665